MDSKSNTLFVGLDVHKNSIDIVTTESSPDGEVRHIRRIDGYLPTLDKAPRRLVSRGHVLHILSIEC